MIIAAFDPGLHHIVWTVTEWRGDQLVEVRQAGVLETDEPHRKDINGALDTLNMLRTCSLYQTIGPIDKILIETQHTKDLKVAKDTIRDLAMVTGGLGLLLASPDLEWCPTGPGGWSSIGKTIRHNRITDYYFKDLDLSQPALTKMLKGRAKMTKRMYGDALDTVGMALWFVKGKPRAGI